MAETTRYSTEH